MIFIQNSSFLIQNSSFSHLDLKPVHVSLVDQLATVRVPAIRQRSINHRHVYTKTDSRSTRTEPIGGARHPCGIAAPSVRPAKFIILNTKFLVFNTQFLVFNAKFLVFNTKFTIVSHIIQRAAGLVDHSDAKEGSVCEGVIRVVVEAQDVTLQGLDHVISVHIWHVDLRHPAVRLQNPSCLLQIPRFCLHNSHLMQNSSFLLTKPTTITGGKGAVASSSEPIVVMFSISAPNGVVMIV